MPLFGPASLGADTHTSSGGPLILLSFAIYSLFCFWVVFMDGAETIEGWKSFFIFDLFAATLTVDELRFYVGISWLAALAVLLFTMFGGN